LCSLKSGSTIRPWPVVVPALSALNPFAFLIGVLVPLPASSARRRTARGTRRPPQRRLARRPGRTEAMSGESAPHLPVPAARPVLPSPRHLAADAGPRRSGSSAAGPIAAPAVPQGAGFSDSHRHLGLGGFRTPVRLLGTLPNSEGGSRPLKFCAWNSEGSRCPLNLAGRNSRGSHSPSNFFRANSGGHRCPPNFGL
jgi:hypothetical protein